MKGDIVYIDYIGRIKETNQIFDLTKEDVAKKEGVFNPKVKYKPVPVIIGEGLVIRGLDEELEKMKVGEKKIVEIPPEKGFGNRSENLIKLIPRSAFKESNIEPEVGRVITVNGLNGRIISVDGGRIKVDFNHPLAGKTLVYEVEIVKKAESNKDKIIAIVSYFIDFEEGDVEIKEENENVEIILKKEIPKLTRKKIAEFIMKYVKFKKVRFVYEYESKDFNLENNK